MKPKYIILSLTIIFIILFNNFPLIYKYIFPNKDMYFLGRRYVNSQDTFTYISFIEQGRQGRLLFENLYTTTPQTPRLFRPSFLVMGFLAKTFRIDSTLMFHLSRLILSVVFLALLYIFTSVYFDAFPKRLFAFLLISLSSGLGFFVQKILPLSSDLWIPESNTFMTLAESPHFILSQIFLVCGILLFFKGINKKKNQYVALSSLCFLLMTFEHPFNWFPVSLALILSAIFLRKHVRQSLIVISVSSLGVLYQVFEAFTNPVMKEWTASNILLSPPLINYVSGAGLVFVFALGATEIFLNKFTFDKKGKNSFPFEILILIVWVFSAFVILYSPVSFQRRFSEGLHIPLSILAAYGIISLATKTSMIVRKKYREGIPYIIIFLVFGLSVITSVFYIYKDFQILNTDAPNNYYYHILKSEKKAMDWLAKNSTFDDVILSNWFYGNILPGITGRKVFLGHKIQTPYFAQKVSDIDYFLTNRNNQQAMEFLQRNGITHIFVGVNDSLLNLNPDFGSRNYLKKVYDGEGVKIYKITTNSNVKT